MKNSFIARDNSNLSDVLLSWFFSASFLKNVDFPMRKHPYRFHIDFKEEGSYHQNDSKEEHNSINYDDCQNGNAEEALQNVCIQDRSYSIGQK